MAAHGRLRRERGLQAEYEAQVKEIRWQLGEQLRCLELQGELRRELLQELAEFARRRAEVELEYSRGLDKLAERLASRGGRLGGSGRELQSFRKEPSLLSPLHCWAVLLQHTRQQSRDSAALGELLGGPLAQRLSHIAEDVGRIIKKSKDLGQQLQGDLLEVVSELQTARKTYQTYRAECASAEAKLREAERQEEKRAGRSASTTTPATITSLTSATEAGPQRKSSVKKGGRLVEKRQAKFLEHRLKCTKARNEYLLSLASVNAAVSNYYLHDILDLMDVLRSFAAAESRSQASHMQGLGSLEEALEALDAPGDKAKVLEVHAAAFCPPLRFDYQPHEGDQVAEIQVELELRDEIVPRAQNIRSRLDQQTIETEEVNKTLKATLQALLELVTSDDGDMPDSFQSSPSTESLRSTGSDSGGRQVGRKRGQQQDTETFYITKLQEYLSGRSILAKLQAKHEKLQEAIERGDKEQQETPWTQYSQRKVQKSRQLRPSSQYKQKLFGGDMEKFIQSSGQPVPLVVESCIRFINLNGLQHEGIFRVSGAQPRITEIRDAFERGEDPLMEGCTPHDLDSVAGVLKLYFRSLEPPLFPEDLVVELLASAGEERGAAGEGPSGMGTLTHHLSGLWAAETEAVAEHVQPVGLLLARLPSPVLVVLRYLFTFLNHLSQYSDENMMDPYNLAVCFGPTLLPVPSGQDPVALQGRVNQLVQTLIVQPARVFPAPALLPGPIYEKCMAPPTAECLGDMHLDSLTGDTELEQEGGTSAPEDDPEGVMEAVACFGYTGRTAQELSFQRGDTLRLHARASSDWWRGEHGGIRGLIPHKYITLPEGLEPSTAPEAMGPSGQGRRCLLPTSPERHVEVDKAVTQNMDSVFKELLGKATMRQATATSPGPRSPKSPGGGGGLLGRNKGFARGPVGPVSPSALNLQGPDSAPKPH
ncbi:rho GTPase-activating protein 4 isoform X2 [Octodon degus]|uniref:Rho GTPase-activating protein 4 isoform X2 n=1 Tax=Octodon degus TaxID=10160 RepID=A0A6P6DM45_OCTDE|nr:rho GTPase-activating protein 4 isoform X2 [Octodon degus]